MNDRKMIDLDLKKIVEAALHAANRPLSVDNILNLFAEAERPERSAIRETIAELVTDYEGRGIELVEVASGFRVQVRNGLGEWISRLWQERPPRYSRALLETLSIVAYRQPVTRGEIEEIRGVSVSSNIMRTLLDRGWVRVVGHRDVPGKPALFATTREFLDYFGLKRLEDLPPLADLKDLDSLNVELELGFEESGVKPADIAEPQGESQGPLLQASDASGQIRPSGPDDHDGSDEDTVEVRSNDSAGPEEISAQATTPDAAPRRSDPAGGAGATAPADSPDDDLPGNNVVSLVTKTTLE